MSRFNPTMQESILAQLVTKLAALMETDFSLRLQEPGSGPCPGNTGMLYSEIKFKIQLLRSRTLISLWEQSLCQLLYTILNSYNHVMKKNVDFRLRPEGQYLNFHGHENPQISTL